jgi:DNA-binding transcriptional regulator LsrR (DeoR family)
MDISLVVEVSKKGKPELVFFGTNATRAEECFDAARRSGTASRLCLYQNAKARLDVAPDAEAIGVAERTKHAKKAIAAAAEVAKAKAIEASAAAKAATALLEQ